MKIPLMALCFLTGCATGNSWHWEKGGAGQQEFNMDDGQCKAQAFSVPNAPALQIVLVHQSCMQGKGWYKVSN